MAAADMPEPTTAPVTAHVRETATPIGDELVADCSCGATYSVPQGGDEYAALEAAHGRHEAGAR